MRKFLGYIFLKVLRTHRLRKNTPLPDGRYLILKKYNKKHKEKLEAFTPHLLRHTFCTYKANAGMSPKTLQYIMGHKSIEMTLDYYAHGDFGAAKAEMARTAA